MSIHKFTTGTDRSVRTDSRGVSEVIGAILIFGLIVTLLVLIQANAVPAANKQVEFEHDQRVIQDFQALQGELYQVGTTGDPASATVETGVVYPNRFFLLNPSPAVGSLRVTDPLAVNITNARAEGNPGDYWNGENVSFTTRGLVYTPRYNELQNPGTKYWEHSMLFSRYNNDNVYFDDPTAFIDGRQIRLTLVDGSLSGSSLTTTVEIVPISTGTRTLTVANRNEPITFTLGTSLSQTEWEQALDDEEYASVIGFDADSETVTIALNATQSYDLRISKVRVGTASARAPGPRYITDVEGNGTSVPEGTSQRLVVEVRDAYNNPVSNVPVDAEIVDNGSLVGDRIRSIDGTRTDSDGRLTFRYDAPPNVDGNKAIQVRSSIGDGTDAGNSTEPLENTTFDLTVIDSDQSGSPSSGNTTEDGVSGINPSVDAVRLSGVELQGNNPVILTFYNNGGTTKEFSKARLLFFSSNQANPGETLNLVAVNGNDVTDGAALGLHEDYKTLAVGETISVDPGEPITLSFQAENIKKDLFGLSIRFADGSIANYFIQPM